MLGHQSLSSPCDTHGRVRGSRIHAPQGTIERVEALCPRTTSQSPWKLEDGAKSEQCRTLIFLKVIGQVWRAARGGALRGPRGRAWLVWAWALQGAGSQQGDQNLSDARELPGDRDLIGMSTVQTKQRARVGVCVCRLLLCTPE